MASAVEIMSKVFNKIIMISWKANLTGNYLVLSSFLAVRGIMIVYHLDARELITATIEALCNSIISSNQHHYACIVED